MIPASQFTPLDEEHIPTGDFRFIGIMILLLMMYLF
jgi:hypothetical protein